MSQSSGSHLPAPAFPWKTLVINALIAAVVALVIGTACYYFFADQSLGKAVMSSLLWAALAIVGVGIGFAIAHSGKSLKP